MNIKKNMLSKIVNKFGSVFDPIPPKFAILKNFQSITTANYCFREDFAFEFLISKKDLAFLVR